MSIYGKIEELVDVCGERYTHFDKEWRELLDYQAIIFEDLTWSIEENKISPHSFNYALHKITKKKIEEHLKELLKFVEKYQEFIPLYLNFYVQSKGFDIDLEPDDSFEIFIEKWHKNFPINHMREDRFDGWIPQGSIWNITFYDIEKKYSPRFECEYCGNNFTYYNYKKHKKYTPKHIHDFLKALYEYRFGQFKNYVRESVKQRTSSPN